MLNEYKLSSEMLWHEINRDFQNEGGAYILYSKVNEKVVPIPRLLETDTNGVLYIGRATSYLIRVINLKKTINPKMRDNSHIGGRRYNNIERIKARFPYQDLYVCLIPHHNPQEKEKELFCSYVANFGEVPPLNAFG